MIVEKPWGRVVTYALNQPSSVRVITVEPGQETSVHYHRMRDETWVVLDPGLTVEIDDRAVEAEPGEEFVIPAEQAHIGSAARDPGRVASWRLPTDTRPRTTPSDSRTRTAGPSIPIGEGRRQPSASPYTLSHVFRRDTRQAPAGPVLRFRRE